MVRIELDVVEAIDLLGVLSAEAVQRAKHWRQLEERRATEALCEQSRLSLTVIERVIARIEEQTYPEKVA